MNRMLKKLSIAVALIAFAYGCGIWSGRNGAQSTALAAEPAAPRLFELRIYTAAPGKLDALHARFRDHTLRLFEKHRIQSVGYWTGVDEQHREKLYYLVAYPDAAAREARLVNGIAKDPEFLKAVAESERDGRLTSATESVLLSPTGYSPMR